LKPANRKAMWAKYSHHDLLELQENLNFVKKTLKDKDKATNPIWQPTAMNKLNKAGYNF